MARLYRTTGYQEEVRPGNNVSFTLTELQALVGGYIETVFIHDGNVMVLDEEGKRKGKPVNHVATTHYLYPYGITSVVVGEAVVGTLREMGMGE